MGSVEHEAILFLGPVGWDITVTSLFTFAYGFDLFDGCYYGNRGGQLY